MTNGVPQVTTRIELAWPNKEKFLLAPRDGEGKPNWVERTHPAASEVRLTSFIGEVGQVGKDPHGDNLLFTGDSLDVLRILAEVPEYARYYRGKIKVVYIDPPFNTGQTFTHYDDWMEHSTWLSFMRERLLLIKDLLAPDGIIWVHLDGAEIHRMRCLMDEVFGSACFFNQVVWKRTQGKSAARRGLGTMCDTILVYGRTEAAKLIPVLLPLTEEHLAAKYRHTDTRGRYMLGDLTAPGARTGDSGQPWRGRLPSGRSRHWAVPTIAGVTDGPAAALSTQQRLDLLDAADYVHWPPGDRSVPMVKRYLSETSGTAIGDLWDDIGRVANTSRERIGYDTQKPESLIERVLKLSTKPGDIVLDCFAGSGTTAAVAHKMGRRWITADILRATIDGYTRPRLEKVVAGADPSGITDVCEWAGGGGFRTVEVGPSMYEVGPGGMVLLAEWATNGAFSRAVAGQLGFEYQEAPPFCGIRGRMRLAVFDGAVGPDEVSALVGALGERERVTVVAKVILPDAEVALAKLSSGSRVRKAPRDLLTSRRRRSAREANRPAAGQVAQSAPVSSAGPGTSEADSERQSLARGTAVDATVIVNVNEGEQ